MSPTPESSTAPVESVELLESADASQPKHRARRALHRPATLVTAFITAGTLGLAGYATLSPGQTVTADGVRASLSKVGPAVSADTFSAVRQGVQRQQTDAGSLRIDRLEQAHAAVLGSVAANSQAVEAANARAEELAAEKAAEEKAAAEQAAAEQAAAEQAAAEQAAAERSAEEAASREEVREAAPVEEPVQEAPVEEEPVEAAPAPPSGSPKSIAQSMLGSYGWGQDQWGCLESLWQRESGWNHTAQNPSSGAYGIPQALPGNKMASAGADWQTNPATQISWGLGYISGRYGTPCGAWAHSEAVGWY